MAVSLPGIAKKFENVTGGGGGLSLPLPQAPFGWDISPPHWLYYEAWVMAAILFVVAWLLVRGRVGRAWRAIRDGEVAAASSGVSPAVYKTLAFGVSSAYAGVAGALLAIQVVVHQPRHVPGHAVDPAARERRHRRARVAVRRDLRRARPRVPADLRAGPAARPRVEFAQAGRPVVFGVRPDPDRATRSRRAARRFRRDAPADRGSLAATTLCNGRPSTNARVVVGESRQGSHSRKEGES